MSEMLGSWAVLAARGCEVVRGSDVDASPGLQEFHSHRLDGSHEDGWHVDKT